MRLVIQRVNQASVAVNDREISKIGRGLLILVGVETEDNEKDMEWLVAKTANMRIFPDSNGVMNLSVMEIGGEILAVSQFTLMASTRKGNRPSYIKAAGHELATRIYDSFCKKLSLVTGTTVKKGIFGADMKVSLVNDGPVTIIIDSRQSF